MKWFYFFPSNRKKINMTSRKSVLNDIRNLRRVLPRWLDHKIYGTEYKDWTPDDYVYSAQGTLRNMNKPWLASLLESYRCGDRRFSKRNITD